MCGFEETLLVSIGGDIAKTNLGVIQWVQERELRKSTKPTRGNKKYSFSP